MGSAGRRGTSWSLRTCKRGACMALPWAPANIQPGPRRACPSRDRVTPSSQSKTGNGRVNTSQKRDLPLDRGSKTTLAGPTLAPRPHPPRAARCPTPPPMNSTDRAPSPLSTLGSAPAREGRPAPPACLPEGAPAPLRGRVARPTQIRAVGPRLERALLVACAGAAEGVRGPFEQLTVWDRAPNRVGYQAWGRPSSPPAPLPAQMNLQG